MTKVFPRSSTWQFVTKRPGAINTADPWATTSTTPGSSPETMTR
jgi:hypothetical protein